MSQKISDKFLATAGRMTPSLRPNQGAVLLPQTPLERFFATASRSTPALAPMTSSVNDKVKIANIESLRARREMIIWAMFALSFLNLVLITAAVILSLHIAQVKTLFRHDVLRTPIILVGAVISGIVGILMGFYVAQESSASNAFSKPKLNDEGIRLKQPAFNKYVTEQLRQFDARSRKGMRPIVRHYKSRKGATYELHQAGKSILVIERNKGGDVLSIGRGRLKTDGVSITIEVIDGSKGTASLKSTDSDAKQLQGTFKNETYNESATGMLVCYA